MLAPTFSVRTIEVVTAVEGVLLELGHEDADNADQHECQQLDDQGVTG
jgi:hypothetical protein